MPREAYDGIVSSGDVTHAQMQRAPARAFSISARERDLRCSTASTRIAPLESADYAVCSGLFDDTVETPQDYQGLIEQHAWARAAR